MLIFWGCEGSSAEAAKSYKFKFIHKVCNVYHIIYSHYIIIYSIPIILIFTVSRGEVHSTIVLFNSLVATVENVDSR